MPLYNRAHRLLNQSEREQNLLTDNTTGDFPFFNTTANNFLYNCPDNVWRVLAVVVDRDMFLEDSLSTDRYWRTEDIVVSGIDYRRVTNVRTRDARRGAAATIQFRGMSPGDTTAVFRRVAYRQPREITSDRIQHECPSAEAEDILIQATMRLVDSINDHEKTEKAEEYIKRILKPRYWAESDAGEQGLSSFCVKRPY